MPTFCFADSKAIKSFILNSGTPLVYEGSKDQNTHGFIKGICQDNANMLLEDEYNRLLRNKLKESYIVSKSGSKKINSDFAFNADYESANLEFACRVQ
jgi:hypothetical protein